MKIDAVMLDTAYGFLLDRKLWWYDERGGITKRTRGRDMLVECIAFSAMHDIENGYVNRYAKENGYEEREAWGYIRHYLDSMKCAEGVEALIRCGTNVLQLLRAGKGENV